MIKKAPISVCMIVRDEEAQIESCIKSFIDYVEELIIVDTGSVDKTPEICKKYATRFEIYTDCNDTEGRIDSFSQARNYSFSLATQPWVMWIDGDDQLEGADKLPFYVEKIWNDQKDKFEAIQIMLPYEYSRDENGNVNCLHYRERLVTPKNKFKWVNNVHEVLIPEPNTNFVQIQLEDVRFVHHRKMVKPRENGRNLRILEKVYKDHGESDPRQLYYYGLELGNVGRIDEAINILSRYVELSGWDDEKCLAALKIAEHYYNRADFDNCITWSFKANAIMENWGEPYFVLSKCFYNKALAGGSYEYRNWQKCAHYAEMGLKLPPTKTVLFVNPMDRELDIHLYYNRALSNIGRIEDALESCKTALSNHYNPMLECNKKFFEKTIAKNKIGKILEEIGVKNDGTVNSLVEGKNIFGWNEYKKPEPKDVKADDFPVAIITPHSQAWGIPEDWDYDGLPLRLTEKQLQSVVILLWKEYMLRDECVAAVNFLNDAPEIVKHSLATEKALKITESTIDWIRNFDKAQKNNAPEDVMTELGQPLPNPLHHQQGHRFNIITSKLNKNEKILDLGCFDGAMTNRWGLMGFDITGVDVTQTSINLANRKALEFNTNAKHVVCYFDKLSETLNDKFDVVTSLQTYEHILDPVNEFLIPARNMLKEDGRMLINAPYGSLFNGAYLSWAHPWLWGTQKNKPWICDEARAHVLAPTSWKTAENCRKAGFWVKNSYYYPVQYQEVPNQGDIFVELLLKAPTCENPLEIVIMCGQSLEYWNPRTAAEKGIGGSETAVIEMAKNLCLAGHKVKVYNFCDRLSEGIYDGVEYYSHEKIELVDSCDVFIAWRNAQFLNLPVDSQIKLLWVHDIFALNANYESLLKADKILTLSNWHKEFVSDYHKINKDQIIHTRNGINLERFNKDIKRNPHKAMCSSSPDRYLPSLLQMWPRIRERVPDAELHIFYGFYNWMVSAQGRGDQNEINNINMLLQQMESMKDLEVTFHDRIPQDKLAEEMLSSGVLTYSTFFSETNFIGGMEAQAAGMRIISSPIAAINETVGERAFALIEGDWLSKEYQEKFVEAVVEAMLKEGNEDRIAIQKYAQENFSWKTLSNEWEKMFYNLIENKEIIPQFKEI